MIAALLYFSDNKTTFDDNMSSKGAQVPGLGVWMTELNTYQNMDKVRTCPRTTEWSTAQAVAFNKQGYAGTTDGTVDKPWYYCGANASASPTAGDNVTRSFQGGYGLSTSFYFNGIAGDGFARPFKTEASVLHPSQTPVFGDAAWVDTEWAITTNNQAPLSFVQSSGSSWTDVINYYGDSNGGDFIGLAVFCVARHGSTPQSIRSLRTWPLGATPPGDINISFFDGHVALVPLANLWNLTWTSDWVAPSLARLKNYNWQ